MAYLPPKVVSVPRARIRKVRQLFHPISSEGRPPWRTAGRRICGSGRSISCSQLRNLRSASLALHSYDSRTQRKSRNHEIPGNGRPHALRAHDHRRAASYVSRDRAIRARKSRTGLHRYRPHRRRISRAHFRAAFALPSEERLKADYFTQRRRLGAHPLALADPAELQLAQKARPRRVST